MAAKPRRAFTLIELLVVLSIIGLLIAILLPALGGARYRSNILRCVSNVKSVGPAMACYLSDFRQIYPCTTEPNDNAANAGWQSFLNLYGKAGSVGNYAWNVLPGQPSYRPRKLNPYLGYNFPIAQCPLDKGDSLNGVTNAYNAYGCSYNYPDRTYAQIRDGIHVIESGIWSLAAENHERVISPDKKLVIADHTVSSNRPDTSLFWWHNSNHPFRVSILFADGHAAEQPRKETFTCEWAPFPQGAASPSATNAQIEACRAESYY